MSHSFLLLVPIAITSLVASAGDGKLTAEVSPEEPNGYSGNPSTLELPLRQDLRALTLTPSASGGYVLTLAGEDAGFALESFDPRLMIPRVPPYAASDDDLVRFCLLQREFNRNEVKFGKVADADDFKVANNCLRSGLWEVMLDRKTEKGSAMFFHGWFSFPAEEYTRLFQAQNARSFADYERILAEYPKIDGMAAPLEKLRRVVDETELDVTAFLGEAPIQFGEQKRKAKLVLTPGISTYGGFCAPEVQPIRTARFSEPGFYDAANPVQFDLAWLGQPTRAIRRNVETVVGAAPATEVEIEYANGLRLVVADRDLGNLPVRTGAPDNDKDTLRLTFGIGTPDIYATLDERTREQADERPNWLFLLGKDGKHVDNHQAGVDRVFAWHEGGNTGLLHLYLVGYERIAVVSHLAIPWGQT